MDSPVVISRAVAPACLPAANTAPDQYVDQDAIVLGWAVVGNKSSSTHYQLLIMLQRVFSSFNNSPNSSNHSPATSQSCDYIQLRLQVRPDRWRFVTDATTCITSATNNM